MWHLAAPGRIGPASSVVIDGKAEWFPDAGANRRIRPSASN
jgi:hypothetical protein